MDCLVVDQFEWTASSVSLNECLYNNFMDETPHPHGDVRPLAAIDTSKPFPCFLLPKDAEPITLEQVLEAENS
jgi:hypothetical protein